MLRNLARAAAAAALTAAVAAPVAAQDTIVLRSADTHPDGYPTVEAVKYMGQLLSEWTNGRITVEVYPSRQLGEERDTIEQVMIGALEMNRVNMAPLNNIVPETLVPGLPYIFTSVDHMRRVMDGEIGLDIMRAMEPHGIVGLAYYDAGARSFYNTVRPVTSVADLEGLRIRVQNSDMFVAMVESLGANATPMEFGQVFDALRTGVIDGAENNFPSFESTRHFEVAGHYTLDEHSLTPEILMISKQIWDGIGENDQMLIRKAAALSVPYMRELWDAQEAASREAVEAAGAQIVDDVDKQAFIDAMAPVYERFVNTPELQSLVDRIRAQP